MPATTPRYVLPVMLTFSGLEMRVYESSTPETSPTVRSISPSPSFILKL